MLADKFWINRNGIQVWVAEGHLKTVASMPEFFGVDSKETEKISSLHNELYGIEPEFSHTREISYIPNNFKILEIKKFERKLYDAGFVYCEYDEEVLTLRSSSEFDIQKALGKILKIEKVNQLCVMIDTKSGMFASRKFVNYNEIFFYLNENIHPRKGKYYFQNLKKPKKGFGIINILYASKTKSNSSSS